MWALVLFIIIYLFLLWLIYTRFFGAEYFPTSRKVALAAVKMLKLRKKDIFYDLGCGGGAIVFLAEKIGKCRKVIGIEIDFLRFLYAKIKAKIIGSKTKFLLGSYNKYKISDATAIFIFLKQSTNQKLKKKFSKLKKGTRIVSYMHTFDGWKPIKVDKKNKLSLYVIRKKNN